MKENYDVIVIGTGAAGSVIAKELSNQNKKVLVLEQGSPFQKLGNYFASLDYYNFSNILKLPKKTIEGYNYYQGHTFGGTTLFACGNAVASLKNELEALGINIEKELEIVKSEVTFDFTDESLFSSATKRIINVSHELGVNMIPMPKFINNKKCVRCGNCVFGCRYGAKWSANRLIHKKNVEILFNALATKVLSIRNKAVGVEFISDKKNNVAYADLIILSAGAINTPIILMNSGINSGGNLSLDLFVNVYGSSNKYSQLDEPVMPVVSLDNYQSKGFIISPFINKPQLIRFVEAGFQTAMIPQKKLIGLMIKTKDDSNGIVHQNGKVSKPITSNDRIRLEDGVSIAKSILERLDINKIHISKIQGAHPVGTAAIGQVVDTTFMTSMKNLYVCDASVLPEAPGLPPILTIMALAKKMSNQFE